MNTYFLIRSIIYLNTICIIIAQSKHYDHNTLKFHDINDPIIDQVELVLNSTDNERIFYCSSRIEFDKQRDKLVASIDNPVLTSPSFQLKTEQANSTTIRIRIIPNGYIGVNRISCHWNKSITDGQPVDLIIGEQPGRIQLKESCQAHDRRYVQCIFNAPTISRAFRNGFPRLYEFSEFSSKTEYRHPPELVNITNENELVFNFVPSEKNRIPKKISMGVNMTLRRFGSAYYRFHIEPIHTTKVDFRIENISSNHLTIVINHNNTGTIRERLCSGHVNQVDNQNTLIAVQDIVEISDRKIAIDRLRPSTKYTICLYCYYERTDQSFKKEICHTINTKGILIVDIYVVYKNKFCAENISPISSLCQEIDHLLIPNSDTSSTQPSDGLIDAGDDRSLEEKYQRIDNIMEHMTDKNLVSPDTIDLSNQKNYEVFIIVVDARVRRKRRQLSSASYYISDVNPYSGSYSPSSPLTYPSGSYYNAPNYGYSNTGYNGDQPDITNYYANDLSQYGPVYPPNYNMQYPLGPSQPYELPNLGSAYGSGLYGAYGTLQYGYGATGFNNRYPNWQQGNVAQYFTGGTGSGLVLPNYQWYRSNRNVPFQGRSGDGRDRNSIGLNPPVPSDKSAAISPRVKRKA
ncbi:unnamed protein product [Rotaria sordida]|uniref:Uncharacterized protein n=1 Tax=Rotaria sordida TaxID=392033 RepID=A0A818QWR6_9BILA|nr:unnamed protein product [Rotaria sordida]